MESRQLLATRITGAAEGEPVILDGETVGEVTAVDVGTPYVEPAPDVSEEARRAFGWSDGSEAYPLPETGIAEVADDEVRLHGNR